MSRTGIGAPTARGLKKSLALRMSHPTYGLARR
jgi:hypothetical protein